MAYSTNVRKIRISRDDASKASSRRFISREQLATANNVIEIDNVSYTIASRLIFNTPIDVLNNDWIRVNSMDYATLELAYTDGIIYTGEKDDDVVETTSPEVTFTDNVEVNAANENDTADESIIGPIDDTTPVEETVVEVNENSIVDTDIQVSENDNTLSEDTTVDDNVETDNSHINDNLGKEDVQADKIEKKENKKQMHAKFKRKN